MKYSGGGVVISTGNLADASCCLSSIHTLDKFVCKVQRDLELYVAKGKEKKTKKADKQECAGRSLLEIMWEELNAIMERLMSGNAADDGRDPGRAEGVAYCIAVVQQPYNPSIDSVRQQAMQHWREENPDWVEQ
jgi:hypothetical protein